MASISELKWTWMTAVVNEIKRPNQFLKNTLFGDDDPIPTEDAEIGVLTRGREIAPFVIRDGEAILVPGHSETFQSVRTPNIRIKRAFTPSPLLYNRRPGTVIFSRGASSQAAARREHVRRDLEGLDDMIVNAEEYMSSRAIQGAITIQQSPDVNYTITFPKPSAHNITLTTFWDDADPTLPEPETDFHTVKRLLIDEVGMSLTLCILGTEAADAFRAVAKAQEFLNKLHLNPGGALTHGTQFNADGVIYLGRFAGVDVFEYGRTATYYGSSVDMIRPKYAEFFATGRAAQWKTYYGSIPDHEAFQGRNGQMKRFSKSWTKKDPSALIALLQSRPLTVPRRPGAGVSMKVVSG